MHFFKLNIVVRRKGMRNKIVYLVMAGTIMLTGCSGLGTAGNAETSSETVEASESDAEDVETNADNPAVIEIDPWQKLVVGDVVKHKSFGRGVIKEIDGKYFFIEFKEKTSKFIFPDAIDKGHITL